MNNQSQVDSLAGSEIKNPSGAEQKSLGGMSPELKAKWVAALRSGEYKQGREVLRNGDQFCCLGVLCDIIGLEVLDGVYDPMGYEAARKAIGQHDLSQFWHRNDGAHGTAPHSFHEMADYIEANVPEAK